MKLSIRDFLWLMVVAAIATAWWLDHSRCQKRLFYLERIKPFMEHSTSRLRHLRSHPNAEAAGAIELEGGDGSRDGGGSGLIIENRKRTEH